MLEKCPEMAECYVDIISAAHFSHAAQELNAKLEQITQILKHENFFTTS
jgi:hypothetical protein